MAKTIAFIPVRGNSKSISGKNIRLIAGKPLIAWSLEAAVDCLEIDQVIVATDCQKIIETVQSLNLKKIKIYHRDPNNAADCSSTESVMLEYIKQSFLASDDRFILIQATNPFLQGHHLSEALTQLEESKSDSLLSVIPFKRFFWNSKGQSLNYDYQKRPRRQDFEEQYLENGSFYINSVKNILEHKNRLSGHIELYPMPEHSYCEIDEEADLLICESILQNITISSASL